MKHETDNINNNNGTHDGSEDSVLRPCLSLLKCRSFAACHVSANKISRSDPNVSLHVDQILAVADVLAAAERRRVPSHPHDWYSILRLLPGDGDNRDLTRQHFKTLVRLLDPNKNKLPFADEALMRVREAWFVLSDPTRKARFDKEINDAAKTKTTSFWTMCPYCWYLHEYERKYEDCTLRCSNCKRTFHGAAVTSPRPEAVAAGNEEYYCYHVSLPVRYPVGGERCRFGDGARKRMRVKTVANRMKKKGFVVDANNDESDLDGVR
ncbi:hypothetical protein JHK82_022773 [Glycine max]|uniref:J domain-containing protein n=1 Tax=Glycine soja TaxID=3848 RepID=A0A445JL55_GLYSO|nr:uncharacterized protein LOC114423089 [Glycine soja]KAG5001616.1 hypothetical protein JHK87_022688 [Glycine soja]KAG5138042.1 hypothetical protein JHK82_022773 [Glycine max]RZB99200.1 hypothetical protein D0Y65_021896 [Glycine soja]